jgi:hypothetical protein
VALATAQIGVAAPAFSTTDTAVGQVTGAPSATTTSAILKANSSIATKFGASPVFFGVGELGGGYSSDGTSAQSVTSSFTEYVDLTRLSTRKDLVVGFYGGDLVGTGVTGVQLDVGVDGTNVLSKTFATGADAKTWFTNNAVDLGSLVSGAALGADTLSFQAVLTVTSDAANSGFFGGVIVGDPPPAAPAIPAPSQLAQAMAGFGEASGAAIIAHGVQPRHEPLLALPGRGAVA